MYKIPHLTADRQTIVVRTVKPRAQHIHEVMTTRSGGRMRSPKDFDRNTEKRNVRKEIDGNDN